MGNWFSYVNIVYNGVYMYCYECPYLFLFQNCSVGVVGKDIDFTIYDDERMEQYVSFASVLYELLVVLLELIVMLSCF